MSKLTSLNEVDEQKAHELLQKQLSTLKLITLI
jgi:hypothetical protein